MFCLALSKWNISAALLWSWAAAEMQANLQVCFSFSFFLTAFNYDFSVLVSSPALILWLKPGFKLSHIESK